MKTKTAPSIRATGKSAAQHSSTSRFRLRLFVAGATARSLQAVMRVRQLCAEELKDQCDLQVIDIYQQPELARQNQIVATPTLLKEFPRPVRRFIGNLLEMQGLLGELIPGESGRSAN